VAAKFSANHLDASAVLSDDSRTTIAYFEPASRARGCERSSFFGSRLEDGDELLIFRNKPCSRLREFVVTAAMLLGNSPYPIAPARMRRAQRQ
jgi:hypothetical protein